MAEQQPSPDDNGRQFNTVKACFYLVALVILVHLVIVCTVIVWCLYDLEMMIKAGRQCDPQGKLTEVLAAALAAALAFAGGKMQK